MSLPFNDGDFANWQSSGPVELDYPFAASEPGHYIVKQRYRGLISSYTYPNISGAVHTTHNTAYCVGDSPVTDIGGGVGEVVRQWATIPNTHSEPEFYPYTYPALDALVVGNAQTSTNAVFVDANTNVNVTVAGHGWTNANYLLFDWSLQLTQSGGVTFLRHGQSSGFPLETATNVIKFRSTLPGDSAWTLTVGNVQEYQAARAEITLAAPAFIEDSYFFPGVTANVADSRDIPIVQPSLVTITDTGAISNTVNANTTPTLTEWRTRMTDGDYFVAGPSILSRYLGNIWRRSTRYVRYM